MSLWYDQGKLELLDGTIDWIGDTIKAMLVTSSYIADPSHTFVNSGSGGANPLTNEVSGTGYLRITLATKSVAVNGTTHAVGWFADYLSWPGANGFTAAGLIILKSTGVDASSRLIAFVDSGGFPKTADGSGLAELWSVAGILTVT